MKHTLIPLFTLTCSLFPVPPSLAAAVPLRWTVETSRATPAQFEAYQGETLCFEATLQSHGKPLEAPLNYSLYWQTNGMGSTYWVATAPSPSTTTNVLYATWSPSMDVGAKVYNCFIGAPSNIYHAAFQLRLRPSPGATPNVLPLPVPILDFAKVRVLNPPWPTDAYTRAETDAKLASAADSATNYTDSCCSTLAVSVDRLESATNDLASSVSRLRSSKLDRGENVALSAVTNAQGSAVTAADVGALPSVDPYDQAASVYWDQIGFHVLHPFIFFDAALNVHAPYAKITSKAIVGDVTNGGLYLGSGIGGFDPYISIRHDNGTGHDYISVLDGSEIRFADHLENIDERIARLAPAPGNYPAVSNAAMNAATKTEMQETKQVVYTWESFLDGSNVVFSITNYLSGTYSLDHAKLQIKELRPGETEYRVVYDSRTEITNHTAAAKRQLVGYVDGKVTELRGEIATKGDKAWGRVSSTGQEVPISNTVWVTEQNLRIAGGMEYERVAVGEGAIYVLTSKGQTPYMQGDEGSLMLKDDGGTNYFGMVRSDSYTIGCNTDGIRVQGGIVYLDYNVTMSNHPVVWYTPTLEGEIVWEQLNLPDGSAVPGASHVVVWDESPRLGAQECYINVGSAPSGFFKATIEVPGDCRFKTNMPAEVPSFFCSDEPTKKVKIIWNGGNPKLVEAN